MTLCGLASSTPWVVTIHSATRAVSPGPVMSVLVIVLPWSWPDSAVCTPPSMSVSSARATTSEEARRTSGGLESPFPPVMVTLAAGGRTVRARKSMIPAGSPVLASEP